MIDSVGLSEDNDTKRPAVIEETQLPPVFGLKFAVFTDHLRVSGKMNHGFGMSVEIHTYAFLRISITRSL